MLRVNSCNRALDRRERRHEDGLDLPGARRPALQVPELRRPARHRLPRHRHAARRSDHGRDHGRRRQHRRPRARRLPHVGAAHLRPGARHDQRDATSSPAKTCAATSRTSATSTCRRGRASTSASRCRQRAQRALIRRPRPRSTTACSSALTRITAAEGAGRSRQRVQRSRAEAGRHGARAAPQLAVPRRSSPPASTRCRPWTRPAVSDAMLDRISPFRNDIQTQLEQARSCRNDKYSRTNVELPNEYVDNSVQSFVNKHLDWPRARLEFVAQPLALSPDRSCTRSVTASACATTSAPAPTARTTRPSTTRSPSAIPLPDPTDVRQDGNAGPERGRAGGVRRAYDTVRKTASSRASTAR